MVGFKFDSREMLKKVEEGVDAKSDDGKLPSLAAEYDTHACAWDAGCIYSSLSVPTVQTSPVKVLATPKWKSSDIRVVTVHDLNIILYITDFCLLDPFTVLPNVLLMHFPYFGFFGHQRIENF